MTTANHDEDRWAEHDRWVAEQEQRAQESDRRFWERLESLDQRQTALLRRIENVHLEVEAVVGDVGTLTEDLVAHKRTPDARR